MHLRHFRSSIHKILISLAKSDLDVTLVKGKTTNVAALFPPTELPQKILAIIPASASKI